MRTIILLIATFFGIAGHAAAGDYSHTPKDMLESHSARPLDAPPVPGPSLSAAEVVRIQMEALRQNDSKDNGIQTTFRFASPSNKRVTGPYSRFAKMIKAAPYRAMLNAKQVEFGEILSDETEAFQAVRVSGSNGEEITYVFVLRRQSDTPFAGCWMTEAVFVKPSVDDPPYPVDPQNFG